MPAELPDELRVRYADAQRGVRLAASHASLGSSTWSTSLFTDTRSWSYLLPVKAEVRRRERIHDGNTATTLIGLDE